VKTQIELQEKETIKKEREYSNRFVRKPKLNVTGPVEQSAMLEK